MFRLDRHGRPNFLTGGPQRVSEMWPCTRSRLLVFESSPRGGGNYPSLCFKQAHADWFEKKLFPPIIFFLNHKKKLCFKLKITVWTACVQLTQQCLHLSICHNWKCSSRIVTLAPFYRQPTVTFCPCETLLNPAWRSLTDGRLCWSPGNHDDQIRDVKAGVKRHCHCWNGGSWLW